MLTLRKSEIILIAIGALLVLLIVIVTISIVCVVRLKRQVETKRISLEIPSATESAKQ